VGRDGTVYAAWDVYEGYGGVIDVFAPGSNTPTELLYGGSFKALQRVATDREGNLYVTYNEFGSSGSGPAGVLEWAPHKKSPKQLQLDVSDPLGIDVTVDNDLVICDGDYYSSPAIKTFPPGQTEPSSAIPGECDDISLARHQTRIFATAYYSFARYQYPSGMGALTVGGLDNVYGVAVSGSVTDEE
jgi:hypothetical protein